MTNRFRKTYRELTADEKNAIQEIKSAAELLERSINLGYPEPLTPAKARQKALAVTKLEESVMWAVKGITE